MKQQEIESYSKIILSRFKGLRPGEILRINSLLNKIRENHPLEFRQIVMILNILIYNRILNNNSHSLLSLTDDGYSMIQNNEIPVLKIDLSEICDTYKPKDKLFYDVWEIIGDIDDNPYYVKESIYFNAIKKLLSGLPATYTHYLESLPLKENGAKPSRLDCYKSLFQQLSDDQVVPFIKNLSECVNSNINSFDRRGKEDLKLDTDLLESSNSNNKIELNKNKMRLPKIFISHNTEDSAYAKAIVELMAKIGVRYDDIFCSSFPGCGVIFGNGILNAIREQFEEYNLFVLFIHSPRFYSSAVSLNEMGAAWILKSDHRSFLTSDCEFNMLKGVIKSDEAAFKAGQDNTYHLLHDFRKVLERFFNLTPINDATWETIKNDFIKTVEAINNH